MNRRRHACALVLLAALAARASADDSRPRQIDGTLAAPPPATGRVSKDPLTSVTYQNANPYSVGTRLAGTVPRLDAAPAASPVDQVQALAELAQRKLEVADYEGALDPLNRLIVLQPDNLDLVIRRAEAENELQRYDQAAADAKSVLARDAQKARAWSQLAYALARQKSWLQALESSREALRLDASDSTAYYVRYLGAGHAGDMNEAIKAIESAARLDPRYIPLNERVRQTGRFVDPKDEHDAPPPAKRPWDGIPLWQLGLAAVMFFGSSAAAVGMSWFKAVRNKVHTLQYATPAFAVGLPGRQRRMIGKYEVSHLLGRGGMGDVYEAKDLALERPVAIKRISDQLADMAPKARSMLIQEAKMVASLHHPAIVDIYEILEDGKDVYLVFEYVKGRTAHQLLADRGRLPPQRVADILRPICKALDFAHGHGLVHRDLKPANIMVTDDGYVKLMDFGIARSLLDGAQNAASAPAAAPPAARPWGAVPGTGGTMAQSSTVVGTPSYMAPEMESGIVSRQGDIYALGVCLYELLTGRVPFYSLDQKLRLDYVKARDLVSTLPAGLDDLIALCLQPDPRQRLQSPRELLSRLDAVITPAPAPRPT